MTVEEFAAKLDGRQYGNEITEDEAILAENLDFLVVFGASDDLAELRGAIDGECDCFEGGVLKRGEGRSLPIKAVWCPEGRDCSWAYETELPHAEFKIMEEGEVYCYGIVCALTGTAKMYRCPFCGEDKLHIRPVERLELRYPSRRLGRVPLMHGWCKRGDGRYAL